ncbi:hypothetical protein BN2475_60006 [Paraburkholderia ribeironis]|uniref:Uncharacterized protein n=1 Tax=Paraburkholderia ribeironis TaxID=1247936 RepID=A0A1N7RLF0_9BURK|nr:hypothetical protein BN2475_60006 [Paraburkholderia ribeironis]
MVGEALCKTRGEGNLVCHGYPSFPQRCCARIRRSVWVIACDARPNHRFAFWLIRLNLLRLSYGKASFSSVCISAKFAYSIFAFLIIIYEELFVKFLGFSCSKAVRT